MSHKVTGLPVVDSDNRVVGVVSDYDMMALEGVAEAQVGKLSLTCSYVGFIVLYSCSSMCWNVGFLYCASDLNLHRA